jgi:predicted Fe-Mo cluster-binding NifX family protein
MPHAFCSVEVGRMRVGIPIWQERISPVFDTARRLLLVDLQGGQEQARGEVLLGGETWPEQARCLREHGVEVLLCGAVSRPLCELLQAQGIRVVPFLRGEMEAVLAAYRSGRFAETRFRMPGCRGRCARRRGRQRGGNSRGGTS